MTEDIYDFECPYCDSPMSVSVDLTEGSRQHFIYDCETCCRPIVIHLRAGAEGVLEFHAATESE